MSDESEYSECLKSRERDTMRNHALDAFRKASMWRKMSRDHACKGKYVTADHCWDRGAYWDGVCRYHSAYQRAAK